MLWFWPINCNATKISFELHYFANSTHTFLFSVSIFNPHSIFFKSDPVPKLPDFWTVWFQKLKKKLVKCPKNQAFIMLKGEKKSGLQNKLLNIKLSKWIMTMSELYVYKYFYMICLPYKQRCPFKFLEWLGSFLRDRIWNIVQNCVVCIQKWKVLHVLPQSIFFSKYILKFIGKSLFFYVSKSICELRVSLNKHGKISSGSSWMTSETNSDYLQLAAE